MTMRITLGALLASASVLASSTVALAASQIGKVVAVIGSPSASGPSGNRKLSGGSAVFEDDKIVVSGNGNAQIVLNDNTRLVVGPGSSLVLDRFIMKGGNSAQKVSIKALRGTFRFITGRSAKSAYNITTPTATIGIRGTGFDFWSKGKTGVAVMNGSVRLSSGGRSVTLNDSCEVGRAGGGEATELSGGPAGNQIISNLPYIVNQTPLNTRFHLRTGRCSNALAQARRQGALGSGYLNDGSKQILEPPRNNNPRGNPCGPEGC